jgi:hypothetical protein
MIDWKPIAELPDELKDGRDLDLWVNGARAPNCFWAAGEDWEFDGFVPQWQQRFAEAVDCSFALDGAPTHYAEINGPRSSPRLHYEEFCKQEALVTNDPAAQLRWLIEHGQDQLPEAMTDLVDRLREQHDCWCLTEGPDAHTLYREAADAIEQLMRFKG